jgi:hypothetical protein
MIKKYIQFIKEDSNQNIDNIDFILKNIPLIKKVAPNFKEYSTEELYNLNDDHSNNAGSKFFYNQTKAHTSSVHTIDVFSIEYNPKLIGSH